MTSPTSELSAFVEALKNDEPISGDGFETFTDLRKDEQKYLLGEWLSIPEHARVELLEKLAERAEIDVSVDFTAIGQVAYTDELPEVRRSAIALLSDSLDWRAADVLVTALRDDPDPIVRTGAAAALDEWAIQADAGMLDEDQADAIISVLRTAANNLKAPFEVRAAALISVAGASAEWIEPLIEDFYYDDERILRLAAVAAMGASGLETWLDFLDEQLQSDDAEFRAVAVASVGELAIPSTVEAVAFMLADEDDEVVVAAIAALGEIGGPLAVNYLNAFMEEAEPEFIDAVETAIAYASDPAYAGFDIDDDTEERSTSARWGLVTEDEDETF